MASAFKFIQKLWNLNEKITHEIIKNNLTNVDDEIDKFTNKFIKKISDNLENFHYNVIIANLHQMCTFLTKNIDKDEYMILHMSHNLSYKYALEKESKVNLLKKFKSKFKKYREDWNLQPERCIQEKTLGAQMKNQKIIPLCVDIEIASICDLACPFCYREFIVTPDKIIDEKLCYDLIDQAADMGVPSMKFNWRGEPLLNPKIYDYINYAKKKGIIETIINTNATNLTESNSKRLINSGLDLMIYSFDGGTKKTYEKMRPGRFSQNSFEKVYNNIKNFKRTRDELGSKFPFTKIQMILTKDTINEVNEFVNNFGDIVDNVSVNQYTERGGDIKDLNGLPFHNPALSTNIVPLVDFV